MKPVEMDIDTICFVRNPNCKDIKDLIKRHNSGDPLAISQIIEQFTPLMHKFAWELSLGKFNSTSKGKRRKSKKIVPLDFPLTKEDKEELLSDFKAATYNAVENFKHRRTFRHKKKFNKGKYVTFLTYLYRAFHNTTMTFVKKLTKFNRIKTVALEHSDKYLIPNIDFSSVENLEVITQAVSAINNEKSKVILYKFLSGSRIPDIARDMGCSRQAVFGRIRRLKNNTKLHTLLENAGV